MSADLSLYEEGSHCATTVIWGGVGGCFSFGLVVVFCCGWLVIAGVFYLFHLEQCTFVPEFHRLL